MSDRNKWLQWLILLLASGIPGWAGNPVPSISQPLFPAAVTPGGAAFVLTVKGSGFITTSVVQWNGSPLTTTFVNRGELQASVPSANIASAGTASITVSNGGASSNVVFFEITNPTVTDFLASTYYPGGHDPISSAAGDFNGDGKLDLVVAYALDNEVGVLLGNGDGTFQSQVTYAVGAYPAAVAIGDFNNDGKLDLAVANASNATVSILLGNGDGTFQAQVTYAIGNTASAPRRGAVAGDFDGDGNLDLAVTNGTDGTVSILLGNGDGTFQTQVAYNVGAFDPDSVAVGDFNGDDIPDLVVANDGRSVSVFLGNGDGTFKSAVNYAVAGFATGVAVADLDGDGNLDLAVAQYDTNSVAILLANGQGTFRLYRYLPAGTNPDWVSVADFNGDGKPDLAVAEFGDLSVSLLLNNGDGFQDAENYDTGSGPASIAFGDFNADGRMDLAVTNYAGGYESNTIAVLLQPTPSSSATATLTGITAGTGLTGGGSSGDVTLGLNTAYTDARYLQLSGGTMAGPLTALSFTGNGSGLTNVNPLNISSGTAGINITGNAATSTNAAGLGGIAASYYARLDVGNSFHGDQGVIGNLAVTGNALTAGSITIGSGGTAIVAHLSITVNPSFGALKAHTCASQTYTLSGAADGDTVALGVSNARMAGGILIYTAWASAADTVTLQACNLGSTAQKTAGTGSIRIDLWKH